MDNLLSIAEAARVLGVEPDTLRKWVQKKQITHYRIGGRPKFRQADLERFIESKRVLAMARIKVFTPRTGRASKHSAA